MLLWRARRANSALPTQRSVGDRQPRTIPAKDLPHQVVFLGGWCANCRALREKGKIRTTPSFALAMLIVNFVGVVRGFRGPKVLSCFSFAVWSVEHLVSKAREKNVPIHCLTSSQGCLDLSGTKFLFELWSLQNHSM